MSTTLTAKLRNRIHIIHNLQLVKLVDIFNNNNNNRITIAIITMEWSESIRTRE